ncbi:MAG: hypothetical protein IBV52_01520 [Candidatus Bathyarchaeota archaeon]
MNRRYQTSVLLLLLIAAFLMVAPTSCLAQKPSSYTADQLMTVTYTDNTHWRTFMVCFIGHGWATLGDMNDPNVVMTLDEKPIESLDYWGSRITKRTKPFNIGNFEALGEGSIHDVWVFFTWHKIPYTLKLKFEVVGSVGVPI